ncbi:MAG: hypothetical protein LBT68_00380 [Spirochaetales bacterium]|jgi:hypothetical protein|nr:hypothetical protein [Spirochaetales bacterium]
MKKKTAKGIIRKSDLSDLCVVMFILLLVLTFIGCASINPMSDETIVKYELNSNYERFKDYQYYVSRDIVLTNTKVDTKTDISKSGQAYSSTSVARDIKQMLSSTPGVALDIKRDDNGRIMLGIAFEADNDSILWFAQDQSKGNTYFYLVYTDSFKNEIAYGNENYVVSYEQAAGIGASVQRMMTSNKADDNYNNMEPLLLYEENTNVEETEKRTTIGGRKL